MGRGRARSPPLTTASDGAEPTAAARRLLQLSRPAAWLATEPHASARLVTPASDSVTSHLMARGGAHRAARAQRCRPRGASTEGVAERRQRVQCRTSARQQPESFADSTTLEQRARARPQHSIDERDEKLADQHPSTTRGVLCACCRQLGSACTGRADERTRRECSASAELRVGPAPGRDTTA